MRYPRKGRVFLRFAEMATERAYRAFFLEHDKRQAIAAIGLYTAFKAAFGFIDLLVQAPGQATAVLVHRFGFVAASLLAMALLPRVRQPRQYDAFIFGWALLAVASTFYTISHRPAGNFGFVSTSPILIVLFFGFLRNRFELQLIASALLTTLDLFTVFLLRDPQPFTFLVQVCATYGLALLVGMAVSRQLKHSRRGYYAMLQRERGLTEAMQELAYRDDLTGVLNRRSFLLQAGERWPQAQTGDSNCLLILDLDHFKRLNDRHGHDVGDQALVGFARLVDSLKREHDIFGRIGGEEFALLLPTTSPVQAKAIAARIIEGCRSLAVPGADAEFLSVSVGIAEVCDADHDLAAAMRRADRALYDAKAMGRGRSVTARTG
ncbi:MAG TPA: GGDEF domain-containing protein [Lysobacter sp.]